MTNPRQILPGTTYLVTRRCFQRQFLLSPSEFTNDVFLYVLAVAARRYGVLVHAFCVMSNHHHLVVTDPKARLPAFEQYLDSLVARALNASMGRWESFWAPSSYSAVALLAPDDIVAKTAYVLANPVAAGLVPRGSEWPGLWSNPALVDGAPIEARRPTVFFRPNGAMPATAKLQLTSPPGFDSANAFVPRVAAELQHAEVLATAMLAAENRTFLGAALVWKQDPTVRPPPGEPRRNLSPRVASRHKGRRTEALRRLGEFVRDYRAALAAWARGVRDTVFPAGTYLLRVTHGVTCVAPG
jgi:REP element-mobilizing transposase RayT